MNTKGEGGTSVKWRKMTRGSLAHTRESRIGVRVFTCASYSAGSLHGDAEGTRYPPHVTACCLPRAEGGHGRSRALSHQPIAQTLRNTSRHEPCTIVDRVLRVSYQTDKVDFNVVFPYSAYRMLFPLPALQRDLRRQCRAFLDLEEAKTDGAEVARSLLLKALEHCPSDSGAFLRRRVLVLSHLGEESLVAER